MSGDRFHFIEPLTRFNANSNRKLRIPAGKTAPPRHGSLAVSRSRRPPAAQDGSWRADGATTFPPCAACGLRDQQSAAGPAERDFPVTELAHLRRWLRVFDAGEVKALTDQALRVCNRAGNFHDGKASVAFLGESFGQLVTTLQPNAGRCWRCAWTGRSSSRL